MLARVLTGDPEVLVLVEPTSAVDAHTEARIAGRLRAQRAGRTTVVMSSSPLMLDAVDEVAFLRDGRVVATGTHAELLDSSPAYRAVVTREQEPRRERDMSTTTSLPIADTPAVRRYAAAIARRNPRLLWTALSLHVLAAVAALAAPRLLGDLVEAVETGTTTAYVDKVILVLAGFLVLQTVLTRYARLASQVLGEKVLAELREDFVGNALALPVGVVESAGSGDLLTRTSRDVDQLGWSVRWALPEWTIAVVTAVVTFAAAISVGWWVAIPCLLGIPPLVVGPALVPRPRQGRLPARERVLLGDERDPHRDRRGRPHHRVARPRASGGSRPSTRPSRSRTPRSATRSTCAPCSSRAWSCPT